MWGDGVMKIFKSVALILTFLTICSCRHQTTPANENESLLVTDYWNNYSTQRLSESDQKLYENITSSFYEQSFILKNVIDDSTFCGHYSSRSITIDSIKPFYDCGKYNDAHILTFIINGFFYTYDVFRLSFNEDSSSFVFNKEKEAFLCDYLLPQVYKNGRIYTIKEAFNQGILDKHFFVKDGSSHCVLTKGNNAILSTIDRSYFTNLPPLVNNMKCSFSPLIDGFEKVKNSFYENEIIGKGLHDDSSFRDKYLDQRYKTYFIDIDYSSIHLNYYKQLSNNVRVFLISINDILFDYQAWFNEPNVHQFNIDEVSFESLFVLEPVVYIDEEASFVSNAFKNGKLTQNMIDEMSAVFSKNALLQTNPNDFLPLETKLLERHFTLNKIHASY